MNSEQGVDPTLLRLAGDAVHALRDARYEEALRLGRQALGVLGISASTDIEVVRSKAGELSLDHLVPAGDVPITLATTPSGTAD